MLFQIAVGLHTSCFFVDQSNWGLLIYLRNLASLWTQNHSLSLLLLFLIPRLSIQFSGFSVFMCCVQILDFLAFHRVFGPWTIIFSDLMGDLAKFATILMIFMFGFNMVVLAMNQPYFALTGTYDSESVSKEKISRIYSPSLFLSPIVIVSGIFYAVME